MSDCVDYNKETCGSRCKGHNVMITVLAFIPNNGQVPQDKVKTHHVGDIAWVRDRIETKLNSCEGYGAFKLRK